MNAEWHVLAVVNYEQNERKATCFAKTKTNQAASAAARFKGALATNMRSQNQTMSNDPGLACFWKWLPRNIIVFFCFLHCHYFFLLTPGTSRDEALSASLSEGWLNHEPLSLSARFCLLSGWNSLVFFFFGPGFVLLFIQGLFSVLECFKPTKGFGFESVTTVACKQKMLIHCNRISRKKSVAAKR